MSKKSFATLNELRIFLSEVIELNDLKGAWLVGGVIRDALLGRPLLDVDIAIDGAPVKAARSIAAKVKGSPFPLGDEHGCWRIAISDSNSELKQIDICKIRGNSIQEDLGERDFTANALAISLDDSELKIIDYHQGVKDLESKTLRMVSERAFDDDPLRMLRAARIAHTLSWSIEDNTVKTIRDKANSLSKPAGERVFSELQQLLLHKEVRRGWRLLEKLELSDVLLPELAQCKKLKQSRFHHLDVYNHTLAVLDNCEDLLEATDFWLPLPNKLSRKAWSDEQRLTVLLAAIAHDLGKPATHKIRDDGRVSFIGHDQVGVDIVKDIAKRWCWSGSLKQNVSKLVKTHLELGFVLHTSADKRERWRLACKLNPVVSEAIVLSVSDRLATAGVDDRRRWVRSHLQLARNVWEDHWFRVENVEQFTPLLDGREIASITGLEFGPKIGVLVSALAEEQAVGNVSSHDQAVKFIEANFNEIVSE